MADTTTTNLGLTKPEVGASADTWGTKLNTDLDLVDGVFAAAGSGTSVGLNVGAGKTIAVAGTLNVTGTLSGGVVAPLASPTFTGTVTLPATTSIGTVSATEIGYIDGVTSSVQTQLDSKLSTSVAASTYAPLASPALTGTPTAPTAAGGTNTTQIATTAFVADNFAPTVSPAFTGAPTAPTAATGTSTTQLATTQFVNATAFSSALPNQTGNAGKFVTTDGTDASWADLPPSGPSLTAVASGSLSDGSKVVVNSDGTVSAVSARGGAPFVGPEYVFKNANSFSISSVYDPINQKVVIAYVDSSSSNQGYAVVGTVSGTAISFGTPVRFSGTVVTVNLTSTAYDVVNQRVVICYSAISGSNRYASAVVGTVSGTSISFGTVVSPDVSVTNIQSPSVTYDENAQKVVFVWTNNNGVVVQGRAAVGTVSGTSISFGTINTFKTTSTSETVVAYDASVQRVVIAYTDNANSFFGTAAVGTVSGTTISFGTPVVFNSASTFSSKLAYEPVEQKMVISYYNQIPATGNAIVGTSSTTSISFGTAVTFNSDAISSNSIDYEENLQKIVISFRNGATGFGSVVVGTVSGSSISFGSTSTFNSASTQNTSITYAANVQDMVISFTDVGNSSFGTSVVFQVSGTNLTASNYIGISDAAYTNGQIATVQVAGAVDDAQSGLTPGLPYYVQPDGTVATTAGFPSVIAGTAVAATKIIVKG